MSDSRRRSTRHQVHVSVRYSTAREFVHEYAENLSNGGLFIKDAHELEPLHLVRVRVELPGFPRYDILAEVVHIVTPEQAAAYNRSPGAGLAIVNAPPEFDAGLKTYLQRLGQRKDFAVFISDEPAGILIGSCGYRVRRAPGLGDVRRSLEGSDRPVLGIIVPADEVVDYRRALLGMAGSGAVHDFESFDDIDQMLAWLDENLMIKLGVTGGTGNGAPS